MPEAVSMHQGSTWPAAIHMKVVTWYMFMYKYLKVPSEIVVWIFFILGKIDLNREIFEGKLLVRFWLAFTLQIFSKLHLYLRDTTKIPRLLLAAVIIFSKTLTALTSHSYEIWFIFYSQMFLKVRKVRNPGKKTTLQSYKSLATLSLAT